MTIIQTERLRLRPLSPDDAPFILALLNEPPFLKNIGDRGVRTLEDAILYIERGPMASYEQHSFGLSGVESKATGELIGICGLLKRDGLDAPDIGYAFQEQHWSSGYASEAAAAVMHHARTVLGVPRVVAIVAPHNTASIRVLEKLGLRYERTLTLPGSAHESKLFTPSEPANQPT